ncbi:MAG: potassium-transporting ATPase subunit C [Thermoplasmata archaeon]|nr:potassium-transporting ATPase subunit C [Thermoplasmata archaeon]
MASGLIGQNITNESLFWLRPSLINDNGTATSGEAPYGPTDPNLVNLTRYYIGLYGLNNTSVPLDLVGNSESGIDPDLTPAAVLVQIPRVAVHTNLTEHFLTGFVMAHINQPLLGVIGPQYVDVISLDEDLLKVLHPGPA